MAAAPYLVTTARGDRKMVHRSTCKRAKANAGAVPTTDFGAGDPATCCKPIKVETTEAKAPKPSTTKAAAKAPVEPTATFDPHPGVRAKLAMAEGRAARKAKAAGEPEPPTPNRDKVAEEYAAGIDAQKREQMVAEYEAQHGKPSGASAKGTRAPKLDIQVRFHHDDKPMPDSQNKLSSVAYYHTKNCEPGADRITTGALRDLLTEAGVADIDGKPWGPVTLTNGVVLKATKL